LTITCKSCIEFQGRRSKVKVTWGFCVFCLHEWYPRALPLLSLEKGLYSDLLNSSLFNKAVTSRNSGVYAVLPSFSWAAIAEILCIVLHAARHINKPSIKLSIWHMQPRDHSSPISSGSEAQCVKILIPRYLITVLRDDGISSSSSSSSTTVGSMPVGVWRHSYYRCPPLPI